MSGVPTKSISKLVDDVAARLRAAAADVGTEVDPKQAKSVATDLVSAGETGDADIARAVKSRLSEPSTSSTTQAGHDLDTERVSRMARNPNEPESVEFPSGPDAAKGVGRGFTHRDPGSQPLLPPAGAKPGQELVPVPGVPQRPKVTLTPLDQPALPATSKPAPALIGAPPPVIDAAAEATGMSTKAKVATGAAVVGGGAAAATQLFDEGQTAGQSMGQAAEDPKPPGADAGPAAAAASSIEETGKVRKPLNLISTDIKKLQGKLDAHRAYQPLPEEYGLDPDNQDQKQRELDEKAGQALAEHRATLNSIAEDYRAAKTELDKRELWEALVQGIGYLVAGVWGMKTKTPINVKFAPSDWEARRRLVLDERKVRAAEADEAKQSALGEVQQGRAELERDWARNAQLFQAATNSYNQRTDEIHREWSAVVQDATAKNSVEFQKAQLELQEAKLQEFVDKAKTTDEKKRAEENLRKIQAAKKLALQMDTLIQTGAKEKSEAARRAATGKLMTLNAFYRDLTGTPFIDLEAVPAREQTGWIDKEWENRDILDVAKDLQHKAGEQAAAGASAAPTTPSPPPAGGGYPKTLRKGGQQVEALNAAEEAEMRKDGWQ